MTSTSIAGKFSSEDCSDNCSDVTEGMLAADSSSGGTTTGDEVTGDEMTGDEFVLTAGTGDTFKGGTLTGSSMGIAGSSTGSSEKSGD